MNFLAHLYLSGNDHTVLIGNFIADFVKGNQINSFDEKIKFGIYLHRKIDEFTDTHPIVLREKRKMGGVFRHYSGVVLDIYYDHFLAVKWANFSDIPLENYAEMVYSILAKSYSILPPKTQMVLPSMIKNNWLVNYGKLEGIEKVFMGMNRRSMYDSKMDIAPTFLIDNYASIKLSFETFFPDLIDYCKTNLAEKIG